jgi:hypothetical protein
MSCPRQHLALFPLRKPVLCSLVHALGFCLFARHQCYLAQREQQFAPPPVTELEQFERCTIVSQCLLDREDLQRLGGSTQ